MVRTREGKAPRDPRPPLGAREPAAPWAAATPRGAPPRARARRHGGAGRAPGREHGPSTAGAGTGATARCRPGRDGAPWPPSPGRARRRSRTTSSRPSLSLAPGLSTAPAPYWGPLAKAIRRAASRGRPPGLEAHDGGRVEAQEAKAHPHVGEDAASPPFSARLVEGPAHEGVEAHPGHVQERLAVDLSHVHAPGHAAFEGGEGPVGAQGDAQARARGRCPSPRGRFRAGPPSR